MSILTYVGFFILFFPLVMGLVWTIFGLIYWFINERKSKDESALIEWPSVAILIPCHNEALSIDKTCDSLTFINYNHPNYEIYFIDDASTDNTVDILKQRVKKNSHYNLVALRENQGKANALNHVLPMILDFDITVVMDADTIMKPDTLTELIRPIVCDPYYDAVTCNPLVYNKNTLLGKIQALEFASIVGLIKRATLLFGCMFTISGCLTAFKTKALVAVNGFSSYTATEDIDITWRLQEQDYLVGFAPKAIAHIQAPAHFKELWKQRKRWALGGWHLLRQHIHIFKVWKLIKLWILYLHFLASYCWAILFIVFLLIQIAIYFILISTQSQLTVSFFAVGSILTIICVAQMIVSVKIYLQYDPTITKTLIWMPWYPLFYFSIGAFAVCATFSRGLFRSLDHAGKWKSPQRAKSL